MFKLLLYDVICITTTCKFFVPLTLTGKKANIEKNILKGKYSHIPCFKGYVVGFRKHKYAKVILNDDELPFQQIFWAIWGNVLAACPVRKIKVQINVSHKRLTTQWRKVEMVIIDLDYGLAHFQRQAHTWTKYGQFYT